jgi:ornithine cyclodeaminase/alanine dehydrogenase-like protein (mu-crystallin family)
LGLARKAEESVRWIDASSRGTCLKTFSASRPADLPVLSNPGREKRKMAETVPLYLSQENYDRPIDWNLFADAIENGHRQAKAQLEDIFLGPPGHTLLSRAAWIDGFGFAVKSVTAMAGNSTKGLPTIHGAMLVFDDENGAVRAIIESSLLTNIKTAADSVLGARFLARSDSKRLLVMGAGSVARTMIDAYIHVFPSLEKISIWNRTIEKAQALAAAFDIANVTVTAVPSLPEAVAVADIISTATMSLDPLLLGEWVRPGTHIDLIGAFRAEMREADDALLRKSRIFVDSRDTTIHHIGELKIPLQSGVIKEADILADLYDLAAGAIGRTNADDITVFKNGGGAHLDLMTARAMLDTI